MNALEFAVKDGKFYGIDLTNYTPDYDYRSLKDAHFPGWWRGWRVRGGEGPLDEKTPPVPDEALILR
jgi:hypothetical protein